MNLPKVAPDEVIQVAMSGAFYTAHLKPLLEQQDFRLVRTLGTVDEDEAGLTTYVVVLGESRAALMRGDTDA